LVHQKANWIQQLEKKERVKGIGPSYPAWEAGVLPLNYTRRTQIYRGKCSLFILLFIGETK